MIDPAPPGPPAENITRPRAASCGISGRSSRLRSSKRGWPNSCRSSSRSDMPLLCLCARPPTEMAPSDQSPSRINLSRNNTLAYLRVWFSDRNRRARRRGRAS